MRQWLQNKSIIYSVLPHWDNTNTAHTATNNKCIIAKTKQKERNKERKEESNKHNSKEKT